MRTLPFLVAVGVLGTGALEQAVQTVPPRPFTVEDVLSIPQPDNLTVSSTGEIAWTFNERGARNVYVAAPPEFAARRLTGTTQDDGQELTQLAFSPDGQWLVFVRGGDHGSNPNADPPNPAAATTQPSVQIWAVPAKGGTPRLVADGDDPQVAPDSRRVAFVRNRRIWMTTIDGSQKPEAAFFARGTNESPRWSPDGRTLAFVADRGDHSFVGLFAPGQPIRYIAPSTSRDSQPVWSPTGSRLAFLREPGAGGTPRPPLAEREAPWSLMVADIIAAGAGGEPKATTLLTSGDPVDRILRDPSGLSLQWGLGNRLVFLSYRDHFAHVYSMPSDGRTRPTLLTPGPFMVEQFTVTPDGRRVVYTANNGADGADFDRRHLFITPIDRAASLAVTRGTGIEWSPAVAPDNETVAFLSSDAQRPPLPALVSTGRGGGAVRLIGADHVPASFPAPALVVPELVTLRASDGVISHGQLFVPPGPAGARRPAVVYVHGGGPRQMLLGWHTRWEYANDYGINQYLVNRGFVVLSVDYRLSVGYGEAFQFADRTGPRGASEYLDVLAAGKYLQARADVDPRGVGVWGASYGGYLVALALGRNSDVFAAGVDIHGVEDRTPAVNPNLLARAMVGDGVTDADIRDALKVAFQSSPVSAVQTWKSPVLLIHGDDDHTVDFRQTVDLSRRLAERGVHVEELVLTDDVHDALLWRNWVKTAEAAGEFFERMLK